MYLFNVHLLNADLLIDVFDIVGIVACSIAGTILAIRKNLDFFGCILISMVASIGGGTLRDILLNRYPLFWTMDLTYVYVITITSIITQITTNWYQTVNKSVDWLIRFFDAIGLSAFSVIGLTVALSYHHHPLIAVLMSVITSVAGGILRDMICHQIPLVLQQEIYLSTCIIGSAMYFLLKYLSFSDNISQLVMMLVVFVVRMLAISYNWNLPSLNLKKLLKRHYL